MNRLNWLLLSLVCMVSVLVALGWPDYAGAQAITFSPAEQSLTLPAGNFVGGEGIAADASGNVIFVNESPSTIQVVKRSPAGIVTNVGSGISDPQMVKVDPSGNVYIYDPSVDKLFKVTPAGVQTVAASGLNGSSGGVHFGDFGIDSSGNIYFSDPFDNQLKKRSTSGATTIVAGNFEPLNMAVDANGNMFVVDRTNQRLVKVTPAGAETAITTGLSFPNVLCCTESVALDSAGNIYFADVVNNRVLKVSPSGVKTSILGSQSAGGTAINTVAVDGQGNVFVQRGSGLFELRNTTIATGSMELGGTAGTPLTQPVTFTFHATVAVAAVDVLTSGASTQDFQNATGTTCKAQTFTSGQTCVVNVRFLPTEAGLRSGAVVLSDSAGNPLSTVELHGIGLLTEVALDPGVLSAVLASGISAPSGVALDGSGNTYIVDKGHNRVLKLSTGGVLTTVGSGLSSPTGVTVDGAGNVYISDTANDRVVKVGPNGQQSAVLTGLNTPDGLAVDGSGSLYVADSGNDRILKLDADGTTQSTVGSGFARPTGVTVDALGNVFVADFGNNQAVQITPTGTQTTVASGLAGPAGVAVDALGDLYVAEAGANQVVEVTGSGSPKVIVGSGLSFPFDAVLMAVNGAGDVYIADTFNNRVLLMDRSKSSLNFGTVTVGQSSSQTVNISDIGAPTDQGDAGVGGTFSITLDANDPNFQLGGDCVIDSEVVGLTDCGLTITFTPKTTGTLNGTVTIVTDAGTQIINLTGNGN